MGAKSFNLWPRCEEIIDSLPDGRREWRHTHYPLIPGEEEMQIGGRMIGRPWKSKSLFVNEAIIHYHDKGCMQMRFARDALQDHVRTLNAEIDELKKELDEAQHRGYFARFRRFLRLKVK